MAATAPSEIQSGRTPAAKPIGFAGDAWGGLAAMLVALPSAIAFGVTIFAPLGAAYGAQGAIAGILGTTAVGFIAATFGGTNRLITAPSAPATAVLSALAIELSQKSFSPARALLVMAIVGLFCGGLQILMGAVGVGRLIKYMPYPVVSGYLSGVGLIIILSQLPKLLGVKTGTHLLDALREPSAWNWNGVIVGLVTMFVMVLAPKVTKAVPAAILALAAGVATYFALATRDHSLLVLAGNKLVIGSLGASATDSFRAIGSRWHTFISIDWQLIAMAVSPALTLAVLLSIDTLKTCVVLDAVTRSRHNSNRELIGQGLGNITSTLLGGVPGSGQMGATLVNLSSGAQTRRSGMMEGALALLAFLILGKFVAWVPIATLAGILIIVGIRMFDRKSLHLLRSRSTIFDFFVIISVVIVAETVSLIAASAVGVGLAILLFVREQIGGAVVRRKVFGNQMFSKKVRLPDEMEILTQHGDRAVIFDLQGSLFFGTTDQLLTALEPELKTRPYIVLDMRRVQLVDVTAAHVLQQIEDTVTDRGGYLIFSHFPRAVPSGQDLQEYFDQTGLARPERHVLIFRELHDALEWVEERILADERVQRAEEKPLELSEIEVFRGRTEETLIALDQCMQKKIYKAGELIFQRGQTSDELFLIRRGMVRIMLPLRDDEAERSGGVLEHHLATFARGDFFGEMAFLDGAARSANAVADTDTELYLLSRRRFDQLTEEHKRLAINLFEGLARALAIRLRHTNAEVQVLQEI